MKKAKAPAPTEETNADDIAPEKLTDVIVALTEQAEAGDTSVIPRIRELIREDTHFWCMYGDRREVYKRRLIESMTKDPLLQETMELWMDEEARVLAGENPTPIEKLLALRITLDGLYLTKVETLALIRQEATHSLAHAEYDLRRVAGAHKRYLAGIKTLSQARKILGQLKSQPPAQPAQPAQSPPHAEGIPVRVHSAHTMNGNGSVAIPTHASNS